MDYAQKMGGVPQASVISAGFKTSPYLAALVNGTVGHGLDYDDIAVSLIGHPSVFLVPAILAIGENIGSSGKDMLTAYVVGYETACHIARPVLQSHYVQGWHSTATFGTLGAATSVAWLLKLNAHQVSEALGIAVETIIGIGQQNQRALRQEVDAEPRHPDHGRPSGHRGRFARWLMCHDAPYRRA